MNGRFLGPADRGRTDRNPPHDGWSNAVFRVSEAAIHAVSDGRSTSDLGLPTLTVSLPLNLRKRGGRRQVVIPDNVTWTEPAQVDSTLVKAIARAFRWRKLLETGVYTTVEQLATAEAINPSYVSSILRLSLHAPDIVEAVIRNAYGRPDSCRGDEAVPDQLDRAR